MASRLSWFPGSVHSPSRGPPSSISTQNTYSKYSCPSGSTREGEGKLPSDLLEMDQLTANSLQPSGDGKSTNPSQDNEIRRPAPVAQYPHQQHPHHYVKRKTPVGQAPAVNTQPACEQTMAPKPQPASGPSVPPTAPARRSKAPPQSNNEFGSILRYCVHQGLLERLDSYGNFCRQAGYDQLSVQIRSLTNARVSVPEQYPFAPYDALVCISISQVCNTNIDDVRFPAMYVYVCPPAFI
jgi:hypothetical protein